MKTSPLISIVTPVYNCAQWVGFTVESVLNQTYTNFELLLINDGSTDSTFSVLTELASKDARIKIINQSNGKQGKARNNGIKNAQGEWIAFLDSDDLWPENKLADQLDITLKKNIDLSFTDGYICLGNQMNLRTYRFGVEEKIFKGPDSVQEFHTQNRIPTSTVLVKKSVLEKWGGFPEELDIQNCEDYLLWTKLLHQGAIFWGINEPWLLYRVHENSSTSQEVKALFPLVRALCRIDGEKMNARKVHLEKIFIKLIIILQETNQLDLLNELIPQTIRIIRPGFLGILLVKIWHVSPRIFMSILWRTSKIENLG